jgi:NADH:ubiquinone oxidoreductase subunit 6 (subunit J)
MLESNESRPAESLPAEPVPPAPSLPSPAAYLPFGAYAPPSLLAPVRPAWTRTYELPSARQAVYAGLQLVVDGNRSIRRASIYIGLLTLGALGPAAILVLMLVARFLRTPGALDSLLRDPNGFASGHTELLGPFLTAEILFGLAIILVLAISIDAQAIAISFLAATAAGQSITLREALLRARQTFWRLLGAGGLVGLGTGLLTLLFAWPFLRPFDSNQGISFIAQVLATLLFTPFAFASTGIVLGDVGAIESLRRSTRLFRARPRIALVVTLFPLVTGAVQAFALDAGAGLEERLASFFHLGEGGGPLLLPALLVLALVIAFGSLTLTIAAIVSGPQVAAFLGLTFYSAGLDRARTRPDGPKPNPRWVTVPMAVVIVCLGITAFVAVLSMGSTTPS